MNRKLKNAIEIADYWLEFPVECRFTDSVRPQLQKFRETEAYTVYVDAPAQHQPVPALEVVPRGWSVERLSEQERENIAYNEIRMLRYTMIFHEMEEKQMRLDKQSRQALEQYLVSREDTRADRSS